MEWIFVSLASALAGFVDAIVGGGGLILVPAMFAAFPQAAPATLFGTNKSAAVWGTAMSTWQYSRRLSITWATITPGIAAAAIGAFSGAWAVTLVNPDFLRKLLPLILLCVLLYTLAKKDLGREHQPRHSVRATQALTATIGLVIGFYDGFFGPGTGSFFVFLLVRVLGYDFLHASINAKLMNVTTNLAAILLFALKGHVVALCAAPGTGECAGQHAGHLDGTAPRGRVCACDLHRGGGAADLQDRLGCLRHCADVTPEAAHLGLLGQPSAAKMAGFYN